MKNIIQEDTVSISDKQLTRREFLRATASIGGLLFLNLWGSGFASTFGRLSDQSCSGQVLRDGGLLFLPDHGTMFVASDFHTRYADFQMWLERTRIVERLRNGDDVYGLIVGDVVDRKPGDIHAEDDGDTRIIERIREIQNNLDEQGERFLYIQGNHENRCVSIYEKLVTDEAMTASNQQQVVKNLFSGDRGSYYQQFNFVSRMNDDRYRYLKDLPVAVITDNGIVGIHAGPSGSLSSPKDIIDLNETVVQEILWSRPIEVRKDGYDTSDLSTFLHRMNGSSLLVSGHTPLRYLPEEFIRDNVGEYGEQQIILATSYGSEPAGKSFLVLDLKTVYENTSELRAGEEIRLLESQLAHITRTQPLMSSQSHRLSAGSPLHQV
ncbi:hypothetical protein DRQ25_04340 [Candidatus Fermentibacteria bacterium]|nr:MAG: hypothetical protein DRQ25_04340 [Candidatus Fermentibacteria bacterium]